MAGRFSEDTYERARKWRESQEAGASAPAPAPKPATRAPSKTRVSNPVSSRSIAAAQDMRHMQDTISAAEGRAARGASMAKADLARTMASDEERKRTRARLAAEASKPQPKRTAFGRNPEGKTPAQVRGLAAGGVAKRGYGKARCG